jgi:methyltransferase
MTEPVLGWAIVAIFALQRASEVVVNALHVDRLVADGGIVVARDGMPSMITFHVLWFAGVAVERLLLDATMPAPPLAVTLGLACAAVVAMRVWVLATMGRRWTIRVVVVPGERPIARGPFRFVRHPNYAVVIAEVLLVPLLVGAWRTAILGSVLHLPVLLHRIRREEAAWRELAGHALASIPRFVPGRTHEARTPR